MAQDTMKMASSLLDNAEMAQNIRVTDKISFDLRRTHLLEARAALMALDVHMSHIWRMMMTKTENQVKTKYGNTTHNIR